MALVYDVMTEEEAEAERFQLLKDGEYDAVVSKSEDKRSSTGNSMLDMTLTVYDENGKQHLIRDFLVFTKPMTWKIIHFAKSAGLKQVYDSRRLCSDTAIHANVRVRIGKDEGKEIPVDKLDGKAMGSKYPAKNKVLDYVVDEGK